MMRASSSAVRFPALLLLGVLASLSTLGCGGASPETSPAGQAAITKSSSASLGSQAAHDELLAFVRGFENAIRDASADMQRRLKDRAARSAAQAWPQRLGAELDAIMAGPDAAVQPVEVWGLLLRHDQYLRTGEGGSLFGDQQKTATDLSGAWLDRHRSYMARHLPEAELAKVEAAIADFARQNPIHGTFDLALTSTTGGLARGGLNVLSGVAGIGMGAVGMVTSPVTTTLDLPTQVGRLVDVLEDMPRDVFLNLEQTSDHLLTTEQVVSLVQSVERFSLTGERFAAVAEKLPADVQQVIAKTLEESVAAQPELRLTIQQVEALVAAVEKTVAQVNATLVETQKLTVAVGDLAERTKAPEPPVPTPTPFPPSGPPRPFDITEYDAMVRSVAQALVEVQGIVGEVRGLVESERVAAGLVDVKQEAKATLALTHEQVVALTNRVFGLSVAFVGFFFGALLIYRILVARLAPRREPAAK